MLSRRIATLALVVTAVALGSFPSARRIGAQQPPAGAALTLSLAQHPGATDGGAPGQQVDVSFSAASGTQVRLVEDRGTLLFDGFADGSTAVVPRTFPRACGEQHQYDLYAVASGRLIDRRGASIVLCPEGAPPTPTAIPRPVPTALAPAAPSAATAAPPPIAPPSAAPARAISPGQPPVPAPPLEPPSLALSDGFVLAQTDDDAVASAVNAGVPLVRLLAIWLRGTDSSGNGNGSYQYVQVANLGGAPQDLTGWALQGDSSNIIGLTYYFPDGFVLAPGDTCRIYVDHPAEATCTDGSFAFYQFWSDHGTATLWDNAGALVDWLGY